MPIGRRTEHLEMRFQIIYTKQEFLSVDNISEICRDFKENPQIRKFLLIMHIDYVYYFM